jgi:hypothetical protein
MKTLSKIMEIQTTTLTSIKLTAKDVQEIITEYLQNKGFKVEQYSTRFTTFYGSEFDPGTEEFAGVDVLANKKEENIK